MILGALVALISFILIGLISYAAYMTRLNPDLSLPVIFWDMLLQALAPNPVPPEMGPWPFLLVMLLITLVGLLMVSVFIGIINNIIYDWLQTLRKGRSRVVETGHTVILGWDEHIFTIVSELVIANENHNGGSIIIMGDKDKLEMEEEIRARIPDTKHTEVVCRHGSSIDMGDLGIVSLNTAKSIIVLRPDTEDGDICVIKALLAIMNRPGRRPEPYHIVTEIHDAANLSAAQLVGKHETTILQMSDIIAHITAQTCRQSGLSVVYTELLNFEGDEIYFQEEPALIGRTFGEALLLYEDSSIIGLCPKEGKPKLNPTMDTVIQAGDSIVAISWDDDTVILTGMKSSIQETLILLRQPAHAVPEHTLILGWNKRAATIIRELDNYVAPESEVMVVANQTEPESQIQPLGRSLMNQSLGFQKGNIADRRLLDSLSVDRYKHVVVLADLDGLPLQLADARTLTTLLHLRDIDEHTASHFAIVSEMLDVRNRKLAEINHVDDFIVSDELASLLLAQISENKELSLVFDDLFYAEGSEIFLKPIDDYICLEQPVNFYTVVEAARRRGEVAIGYRTDGSASSQKSPNGIVVYPDKSKEVTFHSGDRIIVLAES